MSLTVAAIQHDIAWEDRDSTLARIEPRLAAAAADGAGLAVLAETFAVGFSMRTDHTAELPDGPTVTWMTEQAAQHGLWVAGSVAERAKPEGRPRNVLVFAGPDGVHRRYAKRNLFRHGREDEAFEAGADSPTFEIEGVRVSPVVCYDLRFAEELWRQGPETDCFVVVANWPVQRHAHWRALLVARAIENQCYVVGVNRVGTSGDGTGHAGGSCIVDPNGVLVADAEPLGEAETTLLAEVDPERIAAFRARYPFLRDRQDRSI